MALSFRYATNKKLILNNNNSIVDFAIILESELTLVFATQFKKEDKEING